MKKSSNKNSSAASDNQQKTLFQCWKSSSKLTNENSATGSVKTLNERSVSTSNLNVSKPSSGVLTNSSNFFPNASTFSKNTFAKPSTSSYFKSGNQGKKVSDDDILIIDDDQDMLDSLMAAEANQGNQFKPGASDFKKPITNKDDDDDGVEDEDLQMILASESILKEKSFQSTNKTFANSTMFAGNDQTLCKFNAVDEDNDSEKLTVGLDDDALQSTQFFDTSGFDSKAGAVWIFPNNMPTRAYQYNIIEQCLYKNTMVVLPTGLGKTFVAAVVMLNFYRW